jgi:hypothetical protein
MEFNPAYRVTRYAGPVFATRTLKDMFTFDESYDPDLSSKKLWAEIPEAIRKQVEQHVSADLPAEVLAKLRDLYAHGIPISFDSAFFHFGRGLVLRNLCRERLPDKETWQSIAR